MELRGDEMKVITRDPSIEVPCIKESDKKNCLILIHDTNDNPSSSVPNAFGLMVSFTNLDRSLLYMWRGISNSREISTWNGFSYGAGNNLINLLINTWHAECMLTRRKTVYILQNREEVEEFIDQFKLGEQSLEFVCLVKDRAEEVFHDND